jgi:hypothetical protein
MARFLKVDLSDVGWQEKLSREQASGMLEWAYAQQVPSELWTKVARSHDLIDQAPPRNLGEAAHWIQESLRLRKTEDKPDEDARTSVRAHTREELLTRAREFYKDVVGEQTNAGGNLGGMNALLSCSLERYPWTADSEGQATLVRLETLGLRIIGRNERSDDIVDAIRLGDMVVENAVGGPRERLVRSDRADGSLDHG